MRKKFTIGLFLLLAALMRAACKGVSEVEVDSSVPEAEVAATIAPQVAPSPIPPTQEEEAAPIEVVGEAACVPNPPKPEPSAEMLDAFGVDESDWVKGPETAAVTIIEYGDFQ